MPDLSNLCLACCEAPAIDGDDWGLCPECGEDVVLAMRGEDRHGNRPGEAARDELVDRLTADEREEAFAGTPTAWDADGRVAEVSR